MKRDAWRQGSPEEQTRSPGADEKHRGSKLWEQSVGWLLPRASPVKLAQRGLRYCCTAATVQKERATRAPGSRRIPKRHSWPLPEPPGQRYHDQARTNCGPATARPIKGAQPSVPPTLRDLRSAFFRGRASLRSVRCLFRVLVGCGAGGERSYGVAVAWPPKPSVMLPKYFDASVTPTTHLTE